MTVYATCIFCRRTDSPPSKEDVFAKWIAREWPGHKKARFTVDQYIDGNQVPDLTFETRGNIGLITHGPCTRCNNTWMSDLEAAVKPILRPLMRGKPTTVLKRQQAIIARWAAKTAMTYDYRLHLKGNPLYFTQDERDRMFSSRRALPTTYVFAGHYIGPRSVTATARAIDVSFAQRTCPAYCMTFSIGQLALQMFTMRAPKETRGWTIHFSLPNDFFDGMIQFFPMTGDQHWPPQAVKFDQRAIEELAKAFLSGRN
jgi:hypothetical protein